MPSSSRESLPIELPEAARTALERRARRWEYGTIAWNAGEAVFTITVGVLAGSLALVAFGTDSLIEIFSSSVAVWHLFRTRDTGRTRRALRLVGGAFWTLAAVLMVAGIRDLVTGRRPEESVAGIVYLAVTAVVMFLLARGKMRIAVELDSAPLRSEASMTYLDAALATATLTGLTLNAWLGWWWADPVAALIVAVAAASEGRENWSESKTYGAEEG